MRALALVPLLLAGCAALPPAFPPSSPSAQGASSQAASHALKMVGKPYRFGGAAPETGFDCSGLVQYSFRLAGARVPRDTEQQRLAAQPVEAADLRAGDLLFFDHEGKKNSHVGIYLGSGAFVHAPSSGKTVRRDALESPYWRKRLSEVRRFSVF